MWQSKKARQARPFNSRYHLFPQLNIAIPPVDPAWDKTRLKGYDILKGAGYVPLVLFFPGPLAYSTFRQGNTHAEDPRINSYNNPRGAPSYPTTYSDLGYPGADTQSPDHEHTQARVDS